MEGVNHSSRSRRVRSASLAFLFSFVVYSAHASFTISRCPFLSVSTSSISLPLFDTTALFFADTLSRLAYLLSGNRLEMFPSVPPSKDSPNRPPLLFKICSDSSCPLFPTPLFLSFEYPAEPHYGSYRVLESHAKTFPPLSPRDLLAALPKTGSLPEFFRTSSIFFSSSDT